MRIKFIIFIFIIVWSSLIVRVYFLSVIHNDYYNQLANRNTNRIIPIAPIRGEILDSNNKPIAINKLGFKIKLKPHLKDLLLNKEIKYVAKYIPSLNQAKAIKIYHQQDSYYNHKFITIVNFISYKKIISIYTPLFLDYNLKIISAPKRYYPYGTLAAHIIGYVGQPNSKEVAQNPILSIIGIVGKTGLEKYYNDFLEGKLGYKKIRVNAQNEVVQQFYQHLPKENNNLILNINIDLEQYISDMFEKRDDSGAVVVMRTDGAIIVAASFPEYSLNNFVTGISTKKWDKLIHNPNRPFTNRLIHGLYPPGSVIKIALGLIFITTTINQYWTMNSQGYVMIGRRKFKDWKKGGHGRTNIIKALTQSVDDFFYTVGLKTGIKVISKGLKRYGLGEKTGIDLPNEFQGLIPDKAWKLKHVHEPWYLGDTANTSIGQGYVLVTPIQIARLTDLIAIGKLVTPHIAKQMGEKIIAPVYQNILTNKEKRRLHIIQKGMYDVCNASTGTATKHMTSSIRLAGKTGTAQVISVPKRINSYELKYYRRPQTWLTVYGPYKNPQYIITVLVEHGGHGHINLQGFVVSKTFDWLLKHNYIKKH